MLCCAIAALVLAGCASYLEAPPEFRTFAFTGTTLDVESHGVPTDLIATDRTDVKVTRWFSARSGVKDARWTLRDGSLDLVAQCGGFANCDARFEVEVPKGITVLRSGRPTDLRGP
jgi:hypothetical protein